MPIASNLSYVGIAKEVTAGTAVAPAAFLPLTAMKPVAKVEYLRDEGMRGSNAKLFDMRPGVQFATYDLDGNVFTDSIGYLLAGVLGSDAVTGAGAPYSHLLTLNNTGQPASYTLTDFNGSNARAFAGMRVAEVQLKFAGNGLLDHSTKTMGQSFATATTPAPSFSSAQAIPAWQAVATVGGTPTTLIVSGDVAIKRSVEPIHNTDGTATPYAMFSGGDLEVSGSLIAVYESDSLLYSNYLAGTQTALDFTFTQGTGATLQQIKLHMSAVQVNDATVNRGGGKYVEMGLKYEAIANVTDKGSTGGYGPVAVTLQNAVATAFA